MCSSLLKTSRAAKALQHAGVPWSASGNSLLVEEPFQRGVAHDDARVIAIQQHARESLTIDGSQSGLELVHWVAKPPWPVLVQVDHVLVRQAAALLILPAPVLGAAPQRLFTSRRLCVPKGL